MEICVCPAPAICPGSMLLTVIVPEIGAEMTVSSSCAFAASTDACAAATYACCACSDCDVAGASASVSCDCAEASVDCALVRPVSAESSALTSADTLVRPVATLDWY